MSTEELVGGWFCGTLHPWEVTVELRFLWDLWMDALGVSPCPMLDSPLIPAFLVPCSTQPYNTAAILCSLACASQVLIPSCFWGWPCDDSCLAAYQRLHLELAWVQTESCSVRPRNLTQCGLPAFQWVLDSLSAHVCQPPCQAHKFTSILEEGERGVTFHRVAGVPEDVGR